MSGIEIRLLSSVKEMEQLRPHWNQLLDSSLSPTVFDTWEWQYLCAELLVDSYDPVILAAYEGNELVAILPLRRRAVRVGHMIQVIAWAPLGGSLTDYNTLIVKGECQDEAIAAFSRFLRKDGHPIDLENVLPGSPLHLFGEHLTKNGWRRAIYESKTALMTELPEDYEDFRKSLKKKFRKTLRNNQNYMDRDGGYSYHREPPTDELLDALISLHTSRWEYKGQSGALARERIRKFHRALSNIHDRPFDIEYFTIRHHGKIAAILYGFTFSDRFYAYLSGFDMAHTRISPGNMIINECIRSLISDGIASFDMLRGDMKYKQTWATASYDMKDCLYFPPGAGGAGLFLIMKTVQGIKRLLPSSLKRRLRNAIESDRPEPPSDD